MKHYILTRSAYAPTMPIEANRARLALLAGVTAPSLRAQERRDMIWLVLVDPHDPLLAERQAAIASSELPVVVAPCGRLERSVSHDRPYGPWAANINWNDVILTTRLDDDDALAPWAMARVREAAEAHGRGRRVVWTLPTGYRVVGDTVYRVHWPISQFGTLHSPRGNRSTIFDVNHTGVSRLGNLRPVSEDPAWLWVRHPLMRSAITTGPQTKPEEGRTEEPGAPVTPALRAAFPVDWDLLRSLW